MSSPIAKQRLKVDGFDFDLPRNCIAARPAKPRDAARLLVVHNGLNDKSIGDLPDLLNSGDLLIFNDTKVIPAQLQGMRGEVRISLTLHKRESSDRWQTFARPAKRLKAGDVIKFGDDFQAEVLGKNAEGTVTLQFNLSGAALDDKIRTNGAMPLPPYIQSIRPPDEADRTDYQTVLAKTEGAVAAPTAGLHFTPELLNQLDERGIGFQTLTLHVGAGTFLPVRSDYVDEHKMHSEWGELSSDTANAINATRKTGGRIVAVGTTSLRILESAADENGTVHPFSGETDIFITPGYKFRAVDLLATNFHLPRSTLFMLVCAFTGTGAMQDAYAHAIDAGYRFYSYGDACLLYPENTN
ncbi:MAG: tRNA preQ1(34) S-adenosylmethionine ribosyltransferase-isomerase QueA [Rhodospirillaceae bacterium]|jgi:S-adenosylmethionine:tRNA ribosyltransferase-isomerase|nr:tRNA preQ1(34) S-adenosylmethionine ribosyltransferase-isomerase QueA [Rhodospirillaceae bacterium]MBT5751384.1 tRNA preQ1(34) S-adenosylmethionine ribosyltransferase-isomerase QueA [Rhodospirillaceae bacterium]